MQGLKAFVEALRASGGGDAEDAAGGLDAVGRLFEGLGQPSVRLCVLLADAPCHGMAGAEKDTYQTHDGMDQVAHTF
jgi:hypothetical protein